MNRRQYLLTLGLVGASGCLAVGSPEQSKTASTPTPHWEENTTSGGDQTRIKKSDHTLSAEKNTSERNTPSFGCEKSPSVDKRDTEPTPEQDIVWGPIRGQGEPISVEKTLTEDPGDGYNPTNKTVRVVMTRDGMGDPEDVEQMPFGEWVAFQAPNFGRDAAERTTSERLPSDMSVGSSYSAPPDDAPTDDAVIVLYVGEEVSADTGGSAAPHSVDVTVSYNGSQASYSVPVYIKNPRRPESMEAGPVIVEEGCNSSDNDSEG